MALREIIGRNLQHARTQLGLSQTEIATTLGLASHSVVSEIESGHRQISAVELASVARVLGKNMDWFFDPDAIKEDLVALARTKEKGPLRAVWAEAERYLENYVLLRRLLK